MAPAVDADKKYKSPAFKLDNVFTPATTTCNVSPVLAAIFANPTTTAFSAVPSDAIALPTVSYTHLTLPTKA